MSVNNLSTDEMISELRTNVAKIFNLNKSINFKGKNFDDSITELEKNIDDIKEKYATRMCYLDTNKLKIKFYENLEKNSKKTKRPSSVSFNHSTKTKEELIEIFRGQYDTRKDPKFSLALMILSSQHLTNKTAFEKLVELVGCSSSIVDMTEFQRQHNSLTSQIIDLYKMSLMLSPKEETVDLPLDYHDLLEEYQKLNEKKTEIKSNINMIPDLKKQINEIEKHIKKLEKEKLCYEENNHDKSDFLNTEEETFFNIQKKELQTKIEDLEENKKFLTHKIKQLNDLMYDVEQQGKDAELQLAQLRDDFDIINGPFKEILDNAGFDPFEDKKFLKLIDDMSRGLSLDIDSNSTLMPTNINEMKTNTKSRIANKKEKVKSLNDLLESLKKQVSLKKPVMPQYSPLTPHINMSRKEYSTLNDQQNAVVFAFREYNFLPLFKKGANISFQIDVTIIDNHSSCAVSLESRKGVFDTNCSFILENNKELYYHFRESYSRLSLYSFCNDVKEEIAHADLVLMPFVQSLTQAQTIDMFNNEENIIGKLSFEARILRPLKFA